MEDRLWVAEGTLALHLAKGHAGAGLIYPHMDDVLAVRGDGDGAIVTLRGNYAPTYRISESAEEVAGLMAGPLPARWVER